jgi:hypothetical protein
MFGASERSSGNHLSNYNSGTNRKSDVFMSNLGNREVLESGYKEREGDYIEDEFNQGKKPA